MPRSHEHPVPARPPADEPTADNIRSIVELETRTHRERDWQERVSDRITSVAGSLGFVAFHLTWLSGWAAWNAFAPSSLRFDPYPYGLLTFALSLEGVLIATFVLITQNRMSRQSDVRDHLNLQIDMLAEQELTVLLRMLRRMSDHLGVPPDAAEAQRAETLAEETNVYAIAQTLRSELPQTARPEARQEEGDATAGSPPRD